ncbi:UNVERIFIED_CONTAM: hypothetical protein RMT77_005503 [Armadillidium vulgare]
MINLHLLQKCTVLVTLWMAYLGCYALRTPYGIIKGDLEKSLNVSDYLLGYIDFSFSLPYALCSIGLGFFGDVFDSRIILGCGLLGSGISSSVMGKIEYIFEMYILLFLFGTFQALCWPSICTILASWIPPKNRSSSMAIFATCILVGTVCGSLLTVYLQSTIDWRSVFGIPSLFVVVLGILVLVLARVNKKTDDDTDSVRLEESNFVASEDKRTKKLRVWEILRIPTVIEISIALLFAKGVKNGLKFWLPLYLHRVLQFTTTQSGLIPLAFDVGGLVGTVTIIIIFEKVFKFSDLFMCTLCSFISTISFFLLIFANTFGLIYLYTILFLAGTMCNVPEIIICSSYPTKLGEKRNAKSTLVGIVNGIGSLGNVIEGPIVSAISFYLGLKYFIPFIVASSLLTFLCSLKSYYTYRGLEKSELAVAVDS